MFRKIRRQNAAEWTDTVSAGKSEQMVKKNNEKERESTRDEIAHADI